MTVLIVGAGQQYGTIASAVAASHDGDVVEVLAGTYYNDFVTVNTKITIQGVGGLAKIVATVPPPNGKAIVTTNTDVTLDSLELTGAKVVDLNGAGIRYQGGNLVVRNSYVHDNEDGLLAGSYPTGSITIDHSEFAYNGSNGYAHNIYIGGIGTAVLSNSYIHDSIGGGVEYRSRAANTTIINNRIDDNSSAANFTIDLGAGGNVLISGNVIQKTANAQNSAIIHFGGENVIPFHPSSSLTVTNNTIISDFDPAHVIAVLNQSANNGYSITAQVSDNKLYNIPASRIVSGLGTVTGSTYLSTQPVLDTSHPWLSNTGTGTTTDGTITGILVTSAGVRLPNLTVALLAADGATAATTQTGNDGTFSFTALPGTYQVRYSLPAGTAPQSGPADTATLTTAVLTLGAGQTVALPAEVAAAAIAPVPVDLVMNGYKTVMTQGDGVFTVTGSPNKGKLTLGNGDQTVTLGGGGNTVVTGDGNQAITLAGWSDVIDTGAGNSTLTTGLGYAKIHTDGGNAIITTHGNGNSVDAGAGTNTVTIDGAAVHNTVFMNGAGQGLTTVNGFGTAKYDVLDLSRTVAGLSIASDLSNLGRYVTAQSGNSGTTLYIDPTAGRGTPYAFGFLAGTSTSVAALVAAHDIRITSA